MEHENSTEIARIIALAAANGLSLRDRMTFNEMGIDFKVVFATATDGTAWVLRIPRRPDLADQIELEKNILALAKKNLSVAVPDWQIATPHLVAYPLLADKPVLTFDATSFEVHWHMARDNPQFVPSLAQILFELHQVPANAAKKAGIPVHTPESIREEIAERIRIVKEGLGISRTLETRWLTWLDNDRLWPDFTTFVHGDLYAGHILANADGQISGLIDWSEGQVSDSSMDFSGHHAVFGEHSLNALIAEYERLGGRVWEHMAEQVIERHVASPLQYGYFAVKTNSEEHAEAAKAQLGVG